MKSVYQTKQKRSKHTEQDSQETQHPHVSATSRPDSNASVQHTDLSDSPADVLITDNDVVNTTPPVTTTVPTNQLAPNSPTVANSSKVAVSPETTLNVKQTLNTPTCTTDPTPAEQQSSPQAHNSNEDNDNNEKTGSTDVQNDSGTDNNDGNNEKEMDTAQQTNETAPGASAVIIFQCGECHNIVADSTIGHMFDEGCKSVTLQGACNITIAEDFDVSKAGIDAGCGFKRLLCNQCRTCLGRVYASTVPQLDHCRSMFTFDTDCLQTHRIGEGQTTEGVPLQPETECVSKQLKPAFSAACNDADVPSMSLFRDLDDHVHSITLAVNSLTDVVRQSRTDIRCLRDVLRECHTKVNEGENTLSYVHNLMLVWDERIRDIDKCKKNVSQMVPIVRSLENFRRSAEKQFDMSKVSRPPTVKGSTPSPSGGDTSSPPTYAPTCQGK